jgi:N-acetylmuramic acid 6-phosphate etherase
VLDAAECPPTFNTPPELVLGIIAGGEPAFTRAVEGAEDRVPDAVRTWTRGTVSATDVVVGIATSGRTPYVIGGLRHARNQGAYTIGLSCNRDSALTVVAELMIAPVVGPEVISGSTRLKAGTATKMVLNMLTTATMVRLGKTYENLLVDMRVSNTKLMARARRIVSILAPCSEPEAEAALLQCDGEVKTAVLVHRFRTVPATARQWLSESQGHLRDALRLGAEIFAAENEEKGAL